MKTAKSAMCSGFQELIDNQGDGVGVGVDVATSIGEALALAIATGVKDVLGTGSVAAPEPHSACIAVNFTPVCSGIGLTKKIV